MRIKYLATLATISMLSLGVVVGCANPCGAKTNTTEEKANPCASKDTGAKDKTNPCASKDAGAKEKK
ncbi:MAG: hypothetical protein QNJ36_07890 [Calothrix sp. MO_167.B42]|nr:hypothetical protein [Calothrix sp. MO_167.B42]